MAGRRISEVEVIETAGGNVVLRVVVRLSDANTDSAEAMVEKISKRKSCRTEKGNEIRYISVERIFTFQKSKLTKCRIE